MLSLVGRGGRWWLGLMIIALAASLGCGGGGGGGTTGPSTEETLKIAGKDQLKQRLEGVIQSGATGSALGGVREAIVEIQKSDAALGNGLMKDYEELEKATGAEKIKSIAQRMVTKL
jgi:hypothetical protein